MEQNYSQIFKVILEDLIKLKELGVGNLNNINVDDFKGDYQEYFHYLQGKNPKRYEKLNFDETGRVEKYSKDLVRIVRGFADNKGNIQMNKIRLLRISYWLAAIADFVYGLMILIPSRAGTNEYVYPSGIFAAVAISWGVLLLLADKSPMERKWVLLPTILVIILIGVANYASFLMGVIDLSIVLPRILLCCTISAFLIFSYIKAK